MSRIILSGCVYKMAGDNDLPGPFDSVEDAKVWLGNSGVFEMMNLDKEDEAIEVLFRNADGETKVKELLRPFFKEASGADLTSEELKQMLHRMTQKSDRYDQLLEARNMGGGLDSEEEKELEDLDRFLRPFTKEADSDKSPRRESLYQQQQMTQQRYQEERKNKPQSKPVKDKSKGKEKEKMPWYKKLMNFPEGEEHGRKAAGGLPQNVLDLAIDMGSSAADEGYLTHPTWEGDDLLDLDYDTLVETLGRDLDDSEYKELLSIFTQAYESRVKEKNAAPKKRS